VDWIGLLRQYESENGIRGEIDVDHEVQRKLELIFLARREKAKKRHPSFAVIPRFHHAPATTVLETKSDDAVERGLDLEIRALLKKIANEYNLMRMSEAILSEEDVHLIFQTLDENESEPFHEGKGGRITYDDFCTARDDLPEHLVNLFSAENFVKFRRDEHGRISCQLFFQYICRLGTLHRARVQLSMYDAIGDGYLREQDFENYIYELIPGLEALQDLQENFYPFYVFTAVRKFFFFLDPKRTGRVLIDEIVASSILQELLHLQNSPEDEDIDLNWFSAHNTLRVYSQYLELDIDHNGMLSRSEIQGYGTGSMTTVFIERIFEECMTYDGEIDYKTFLDFVLAMECKKDPVSLAFLFRLLDIKKQGYLDRFTISHFFSEIVQRMRELDGWAAGDVVHVDDVCDEIFDMCRPKDPMQITLDDLICSNMGDTVVTMLTDLSGFWAYDNREHLIAEEARERAQELSQ